jgi:predicted TIM-barrel fold metal-dependent hydrolase
MSISSTPRSIRFPKNVKRPQEATVGQALANAEQLGLPNMVFVQLSSYGNDNTWVLDALKEVGPARGRGVVAFDPEHVDSQTLQQWHDLGVRGVRLNFRSAKTVLSKTEIQAVLRKYAEKLDHVQPLVSELEVKIVLEHFASPASLPLEPAKQPGWDALKGMMEDPRVYVKISAPYLFSKDSDFKNLEALTKSF